MNPAECSFHKPKLDPAFFKERMRIAAWPSFLLSLFLYGFTVLLAWVGGPRFHWIFALPAFVIIGGLQNHLLILLHEGAHRMVHPNRTLNDLITDIFAAVPFFTLVKNYRDFHLEHHRHCGDPKRDPEIEFYRAQNFTYERRSLIPVMKMLLRDFCGINLVHFLRAQLRFIQARQKQGALANFTIRDLLLYVTVWGATLFLAIHFNFAPSLVAFWILPQLTITPLLLKLHGYGEHTGKVGPTEFDRTFFHDFNPVANFFVYPINSGHHIEHHLFPQVPWYEMKSLRAELIKNPRYRQCSEPVTLDGVFRGRRTILNSMIHGQGRFSEKMRNP